MTTPTALVLGIRRCGTCGLEHAGVWPPTHEGPTTCPFCGRHDTEPSGAAIVLPPGHDVAKGTAFQNELNACLHQRKGN